MFGYCFIDMINGWEEMYFWVLGFILFICVDNDKNNKYYYVCEYYCLFVIII